MLPVLSQGEADLTACFAQDIGTLVETFSEKDTSGKQSLQQMLAADTAAFSRASIRVLSRATASPGFRYVVHLLRKHNLLMEALADPRGNREDAVGAARMIPQIGASIDADLEKVLSAALSQPKSAANNSRVMRLLDVLEAASAQPRLYLFQAELLGHPDGGVRSRSALLIARSSRSPALVGRLLLDDDVRVQANAVEALWTFDPEEARPLLLNASRSKTPRVAANAAVGLHRVGDLQAFQFLFSMADHQNSGRRTSAAWAMGETGDPRFLPFLTAWFPRSNGNERVHILQALGRIRRREKSLTEVGRIEIRVWDLYASGSNRRAVFTLQSDGKPDLTGLKATDFSVWEGESLVQDYQVSVQPNPAVAISGFVMQRPTSEIEPYGVALRGALERCLKYKRPDDLWRIDRYLTEPRGSELAAPLEKAALPYEDSLLGVLGKTQRGFLSTAEALRKIVESAGPKERAADDAVAAFDRQSDAMIKFSGKRTLFLCLSTSGRPERHFVRLRAFVEHERITLHGFAPQNIPGCEEFERLCLATEGGSFTEGAPERVAYQIERIYAQTMNRFEVSYRVPQETEPVDSVIQITSGSGCGRARFSFTPA